MAEKMFRPAFRCMQHPKADQNTQQLSIKIESHGRGGREGAPRS